MTDNIELKAAARTLLASLEVFRDRGPDVLYRYADDLRAALGENRG